jgi:hypothetical protein
MLRTESLQIKTEVRCAGGRGRQYSPVTAPRISTTRLQETEDEVEKKMVGTRWKNEERSDGGELITRRDGMKRRAVNLAFPRTHPRLPPARVEPIFLATIARACGSRA